MLSLLALCRYRDPREEFIHVLFGGVRPEPEPSCRISIAPIILFSTCDVLSGVVASFGICHYVLAAPPLVSPWSAVWQRSGRGARGYINPSTTTFNIHRTPFASFFRSTRIKATQLNSPSFALSRHRSSDTMVAFKLATLLAVATAVAAYPGGLLTRAGTCSSGTLQCCDSIQVRESLFVS